MTINPPSLSPDYHEVYFYGSTRIVTGYNSMQPEGIRARNQLVGLNGISKDIELINFGEECLIKEQEERTVGLTGVIIERAISIVPFRYHLADRFVLQNLVEVLTLNETQLFKRDIRFPLLSLKSATAYGYSLFGKAEPPFFHSSVFESYFKYDWCCFGHYYLYQIKQALKKKGYTSPHIDLNQKEGNLLGVKFVNQEGHKVRIHADAGI